jgi:hypothetical protein
LILAKNVKLLIFLPLFLAIVAICIVFSIPKTYTSEAIFSVTGPASSIALERMESQLVLDKVVSKFSIFKGMSKIQAREQLKERIKVIYGRDKILILEVTTDNPDQSKNLATAMFEEWMQSDVFGMSERENLEQRLSYAKTGLDAVNAAIVNIKNRGVIVSGDKLSLDNSVSLLRSLSDMQIKYLNDLMNIYKELQDVSQLDIKQSPTLPVDGNPRGGVKIVIKAYLITLILLIIFVIFRDTWLNSNNDPDLKRKREEIKIALRLR